jgi:hypothetical protein
MRANAQKTAFQNQAVILDARSVAGTQGANTPLYDLLYPGVASRPQGDGEQISLKRNLPRRRIDQQKRARQL